MLATIEFPPVLLLSTPKCNRFAASWCALDEIAQPMQDNPGLNL
jgi:hypothetical protein